MKPTLSAATAGAVREDEGKYKGRYLSKGLQVTEPSSQGRDKELAGDLWKISETAIEQMIAAI